MNLIFWHNIISPHQSAFMRELAKGGHDVLVVTTEEMTEDRRQLGWDVPVIEPARLMFCLEKNQVEQIIRNTPADSIHFIAGARAVPLGKHVAECCRESGRRMGIITESPDPRGLGGVLRHLKYSWERIRIGKKIDFVLAMGEMGVLWFQDCGYSDECYPFAYVTEEPPNIMNSVGTHKCFRFLFIGQLIKRKGIDLLLKASASVPDAELVIIGDGSEKNALQSLAKELDIADNVVWLGKMPASEIHSYLLDTDVMVLPSRHDGWGAVVNESLMAGTPVICSSACGAAELIRHPWLGSVFQKNNVRSLERAMLEWQSKSIISIDQRQRVQRWSRCIEGKAVARYMEGVLYHVYEGAPKPQPPWRK